MRIAIYARVSTDDKGQDPENQVRQLRQWCASAGHDIAHEYIDRESGRKGTIGRKQFAALFEDAHKRKFDCVLFWSLDRFSREGMVPTIMHLQRLSACGVSFHSYTEAHLATDNDLVRNILLALPRWPRSRRRRYQSARGPACSEPERRASTSAGQAFHTSCERRSPSVSRQARRPMPSLRPLVSTAIQQLNTPECSQDSDFRHRASQIHAKTNSWGKREAQKQRPKQRE